MPVTSDARKLSRRKLRYRLYRIASGDPLASDGLKKHFESQDEFDGWHNFGVSWDTGPAGTWPEGHFVAQPLTESLEAQWQRTLLGLVREFPATDDSEDA